MKSTRASGILCHFTSLPSRYGVGDIGNSARKFINFLASAQQSVWQFLPVGPTGSHFGHSPYMSNSVFAGSPLLICPDQLLLQGYLDETDLKHSPDFSPYTTDYNKVAAYKAHLLGKVNKERVLRSEGYKDFIVNNTWIEDFALFRTLKEIFAQKPWNEWPDEFKLRDPQALRKIFFEYEESIQSIYTEQYLFYSQWHETKHYAQAKNITLFGDLPIYVSHDSAEVWAQPDIFRLAPETYLPTHVAGVPPDYFSETGQRWGNPLYNWESEETKIQEGLLAWWTNRFAHLYTLVDKVRIDHFRAFESYWEIPAEEKTAVHGAWKPGPGVSFFNHIFSQLGQLDIAAEDLGIITEKVENLRDELDFPGMKVLQFGFDGNPYNSHLPHNYQTSRCIVYTGTHDNDTSVGWYLSPEITDTERSKIKKCTNRELEDGSAIHRDFIYLAHSSIAELSIIPLQDLLGFGSDCRMNRPGIAEDNWQWRCAEEFLTRDIAQYLSEITDRFGRSPHLGK